MLFPAMYSVTRQRDHEDAKAGEDLALGHKTAAQRGVVGAGAGTEELEGRSLHHFAVDAFGA